MNKQRGYYGVDIVNAMLGAVIFGIIIGIVLTFGLPFIWEYIKPVIHALTA